MKKYTYLNEEGEDQVEANIDLDSKTVVIRDNMDEYIHLYHNQALRLLKWLQEVQSELEAGPVD